MYVYTCVHACLCCLLGAQLGAKTVSVPALGASALGPGFCTPLYIYIYDVCLFGLTLYVLHLALASGATGAPRGAQRVPLVGGWVLARVAPTVVVSGM